MVSNAPLFQRDALDFIERIQHLSTTAEIMDAMMAALGQFGARYVCFNFLPDPNQSFADVLMANRLPAGWVSLYDRENFIHADPSIRHCRRTLRPYRWFRD